MGWRQGEQAHPRYTVLPNPQHQDPLECLKEREIQELSVNFNKDITFEAEHNSGFLKTNSYLNSTLPQCDDIDREGWLLRTQDLQQRGAKAYEPRSPLERNPEVIKVSSYEYTANRNHNGYGL